MKVILATSIFAQVLLASTTSRPTTNPRPADACDALCLSFDSCGKSKYNSYCKSTQNPRTCFGLYKKPTGGYCFHPTDATCNDRTFAPVLCSEAEALYPNAPRT